jgi:regulatory protein
MSQIISALTVQKRNPQRVNVYLDGEFAFGLSRIVAAWLQVGQELTAEKIAELQAQDEAEVALQRAIRLIEIRPRSTSEIQRKLEKNGVVEPVIEDVLERLERNGLLNDSQFAQLWVENRLAFHPRGRRALAYELRGKGIPDAIIQQTLDQYLSDEEALAYAAAQKYARKLDNLEKMDFRRKLGGFLARRGFEYDTAAPVIERLWDEMNDPYAAQSEIIFDNEVDE